MEASSRHSNCLLHHDIEKFAYVIDLNTDGLSSSSSEIP